MSGRTRHTYRPFTVGQQDALIAQSLSRPQRNLFGDLGPRCPPCSGLGYVLAPKGGYASAAAELGRCTSTSICRCKGSGVDFVRLDQLDREMLWRRIARIESLYGRKLQSLHQLPTLKMSRQYWMETIAWAVADGTAIANTVTETIVMPNVTIPANYMADGRALLMDVAGRLSTTATPTIRFRVRWGGVSGTVIWDSGTITTATVTAALWALRNLRIQTRSNGATGTLFTIGDAFVGSAAAPTVGSATGAPAIGVFGSAGDDTPAAVTVDLTADTALAVTAQWSAASASNTLTGHQYYLESTN